jgi:hypothetical protein
MTNFKEYALNREREEIIALLGEHGIDLKPEQVEMILEAGWLSGAKSKLGKAALLASMPFAMSANWANNQPQPYHFSGERMMANQQRTTDDAADKAYTDAGGPEFRDADSEKFLKFRKTPQHAEILKKAGLPSSFIPSSLRHFAYGTQVSTAEEFNKMRAEIKGEIQKRFGRDSFVSIVQSKDTVTGGAVLLVRANGVVMAMNEQDAVHRAEIVMKEIARDKGFEVEGFKDMHKPDVDVKLAPRSTVDFAAESAGTPHMFSVQFKLVPRRK